VPSDLSTISKLPSNIEFARYVEENILEASLRKLTEYGPLLQLETSCKFYGRRPTGKLRVERPVIVQKSDVWVHDSGKLLIAVDLPLNLSKMVEALLSASFCFKLGEVQVLRFDNRRFVKLLDKVMELGGKLTSVHLLDVRRPFALAVLQASATRGGAIQNIQEILEAMRSARIKRLGFHLPLHGDFFSLWIANSGNGTLYSPSDPQPHQIGRLLGFFEKLEH